MDETLPDDAAALAERLFDLARAGDLSALAGYLDAGVPADLTNSKGDTLLILAAYHQHLDLVHALIDRGADLDRINDRGQTALAAAVFRNSVPITTALLEAGSDVGLGVQKPADIATFFNLPQMAALLAGR